MSKIVLKTIDDLKEMLHSAIMYAIKKRTCLVLMKI